MTSCAPRSGPLTEPEIPPSAYSLLLAAPIIEVDENSLTSIPIPERVTLNSTTVHCWRVPSDDPILRFGVELRESAHLSFRLGAKTQVSIHVGDLEMRVEYIPKTLPADFINEDAENPIEIGTPVTIWQTTPIDLPTVFSSWYYIDVALSRFSPGDGELRFIIDGPLSTEPGMAVYFGQPTIYFPDEVRRKNILLIGVDTLRADSLTPYGADPVITPVLNEMAENGVLFEQARSQSSWTLPSFASMITGRLPSEIGSTIYTGYIPDRNLTISEILFKKGYATSIICANKWIGNDQSGFEQGIEEMWFENNAQAAGSVEIVKDFIARSSGRDWFCFLHLMDPHIPYAPPPEFADLLLDPDYEGYIGTIFGAIEEWKSAEIIPEPADLQRARNLYDAEVASLDHALGDLFAFLDESGLTDDTLIIFASDHGEEFFDHGGFEHGHTHYDELVRMPLILSGGDFSGGLRIDDNVGNTDIVPTILDYIDLPLPENLTGVPLQDVAAGNVETGRIIYGEDNSRGTHRKFCVQWPYKCIFDFVTAEIRLYNLESDPGETVNIFDTEPEPGEILANAIALRMRPEESAFHIWISRSYNEPSQVFEGTFSLPGGFKSVEGFMLVEGDTFSVEGDTVSFEIYSARDLIGPNKHILVIPNDDTAGLEASLTVGRGIMEQDRFFPYGTREEEPSGFAIVRLDDYAAGPNLPLAIQEFPAACYIWGVKGYSGDETPAELDQETIDALRAIGYFSE